MTFGYGKAMSEQFPGAVMRFEKPFKTSILLLASGKVIIAGLESSAQIDLSVKQLKQIVKPILRTSLRT
jgi:TATA-box binding protein (TBP) (component of TFIID and TFIIIB)